MKAIITIKFLVLISLNAALSQNNGHLLLQGNKLKGKCGNKYFTGFVIELDSTYTHIDSTTFIKSISKNRLNQFQK